MVESHREKGNELALVSMTGFARAEGKDETYSWAWEVKSVNGKSLDTRTRVPTGFDRLELAARKMAGSRLRRGNVNLTLTVDTLAATSVYRINADLLDQMMELKSGLSGVVADGPPTLEGLLAIRGMIESVEPGAGDDTVISRDEKILKTLDDALAALSDMRAAEGRQLTGIVETLLTEIETLLARAKDSAAAQPQAIYAKTKELLDELISEAAPLSEDRLHQEVALIAGRADVREELDRLSAHLISARALIGEGGSVGRKLDFLCQEFNREANTLCAKAAELDLHSAGLEMKAAIDQLREQVQNIE